MLGYCQVDRYCLHPFLAVLGETLRNVPLAQIVLPQKFVGLGKDVEWFPCGVGQKCHNGGPCPVENSPIVEDDLSPHQHTGDVVDVVAHLVVVEQLAVDPVQHQFFV